MCQENFIPLFHEIGEKQSGFCDGDSKYRISWSDYKFFLNLLSNHLPESKIITFDDGGFSNYEAALYASSLGFKIKLFVCTQFIGSRGFLSKEALRDLALNTNIDICSHSVSHPSKFNLLTKNQKQEELIKSKIQLEDILGASVTEFSFPGGLSTINDVELAENIYEIVYTSWRIINKKSSGIRRVSIEKNNVKLIANAMAKKSNFDFYMYSQDMKLVAQLMVGNILKYCGLDIKQ